MALMGLGLAVLALVLPLLVAALHLAAHHLAAAFLLGLGRRRRRRLGMGGGGKGDRERGGGKVHLHHLSPPERPGAGMARRISPSPTACNGCRFPPPGPNSTVMEMLMAKPVRRIVTGHDGQGRSIVQED